MKRTCLRMRDDNVYIDTNEYQTPITRELLDNLNDEVREQFLECINTIQFVKNLISPTRERAKDRPRDSEGRIIVDITRPHILEDMDYFRQRALFFEENKCYTYLKPNKNPNSEYQKFWNEEIRRIREGYVRESDGEWVTGMLYYYMNYCPIMLNRLAKGSARKANRVEGFPLTWEGIYLRFHYLWQARENGQHAIELARRGASKSFSLASIMTHNIKLGEDSISTRRVTTVLTAFEREYLAEADGTLSKFIPMMDFGDEHTPFPHLRLRSSMSDMFWEMGYKDKNGGEHGSKNTVMGVSSQYNTDKLRGKRGWILVEEMGTFRSLLALYGNIRNGVEEGDQTFATIYLVGTSSEEDADFASAKALLYGSEGHNIYSVENVYDKPKQGKPKFGFFFPAYLNRAGCYDENGNSDVVKALIQILNKRYIEKKKIDARSALRAISEMPITPAEAMIKVKNAYFPVTALQERVTQLDTEPHIFDDVFVGDLVQVAGGRVEFRMTDAVPIREYGVANNTPGAIEIYEMPVYGSNGKIPYERYIIGHDPVDNDVAESDSLTSTFVFDTYNDRIVAEYTGRQQFADDNYEKVRLLCIFYNAKCLYESNKKGIFPYFKKMACLHYFAETPEWLRDQQLVKYSSFGSSKYGVNASSSINNKANEFIKDWLMKPVPVMVKDDDGDDVESTMPMLYTIRCRALLQECISFNPAGNFDRIRALGMVMLYREEILIKYQGGRHDDDSIDDDDRYKMFDDIIKNGHNL